MHVSSYETTIRAAFDEALGALPEDKAKLIKGVTDKIGDEIIESLRESVDDYLFRAIKDDMCRIASEIAESMLRHAMAGDEQTIRNLFGFTEYYMRHAYVGRLPTQWALLDAIVERKPDLFRDEKLAQQARQIELLNTEIAQHKEANQRLRDYYEGR